MYDDEDNFIFQGVYIATGFDTSNFEKLNYLPKTIAYGTYKIRVVLKVSQKCVSCGLLFDIKC